MIKTLSEQNQKVNNRSRVGGRDAVPPGDVNGDVPGGLFCGRMVAVSVLNSFLTGGQAVASGGGTRLLSGPSSEANGLLFGIPLIFNSEKGQSGWEKNLVVKKGSGSGRIRTVKHRIRCLENRSVEGRGQKKGQSGSVRSEKVCRSEKNVMAAKTALAVRPGCGRRSFAVHIQVVSRCGAPLMFKYSPGVRRGLKSWVWMAPRFAEPSGGGV